MSSSAAVPGSPDPAGRTPRVRRRSYYLPIALVAVIALAASFLGWRLARHLAHQDLQDFFDHRVRDVAGRIEGRVAACDQVLRGLHGLFVTGPVTRREFSRYVGALRLEGSCPGIRSVGFAAAVPAQDLAAHEAGVRADGLPDYHVRPGGPRERYTPIVFIEPFTDRSVRELGYDMGSEAVQREAMERAVALGAVAASGAIRVGEKDRGERQAGFLMVGPVFAPEPAAGAPPRGGDSPRRAVAGWVYALIGMNDLMADIVEERSADLDVLVYDGDRAVPAALMHDTSAPPNGTPATPAMRATRSLDVGGHRWTLEVTSRPTLEARIGRGSSQAVLVGWLVASVLLVMLTWTLAGRNRTLEVRVAERTVALAESEEKYRVIFENELAAICIFELGTHRFVDVNHAHEMLYGWSREELLAGMTISDITAEPDGSLRTTAQAVHDGTIFIPLRWHRKKDGTVFPVEIVGGPYMYRGRRVMFAMALDITARVQAEETARARSAELDQFFTQNLDLLCIADTNGRFLRLNPEWERALGYPLGELVGAQFLDFVHPDDLPGTLDAVGRLARQEPVRGFVNRYRARDGSYRIIEWRSYPSGDMIYAAARDITEQRRLQDELARLTREQSVILEHANVGITLVQNRTQVWGNRRQAQLFGYVPEEMNGLPTRTFFGSEEAYDRLGREAYPVLNQGGVYQVEMPMRRRDGTDFWASINGKAITPAQMDAGSIWIIEDISERKEMEARLRASEEKYSALFRLLPVGVSITDASGHLVEANEATETILGLPPGQHLERTLEAVVWDVVRPDGSPMPASEQASVRAMTEKRLIADVEMGVKRPDGGQSWLLVSAMPVPVEGYGVAVVYKDITERRLAEEAVRRSLLEKETLLREIHHRVKNNLQVISSMLDLQASRLATPELQAVFRVAQSRIKAMALLHERLYKTENLASIDFADYLRALVGEAMAAHGASPSRVTARVEAHGITLGLDTAIPCALAVSELLNNSIKHGLPAPRTGEVSVELAAQPGGYVLTVRDNGVGLPPGFDLARSRSLGLQLVGVLARQLRGSFSVADDEGTLARIVFPGNEARA